MIYAFEFIFLLMIIGITKYHKNWFAGNYRVGIWFHTLWGLVYYIPAAYLCIHVYSSVWLAVMLVSERFVFYNPILNIWRTKYFFYISVQSGKGSSLWDRIEIGWKGAYPYVWVVCSIAFVVSQFYLHK